MIIQKLLDGVNLRFRDASSFVIDALHLVWIFRGAADVERRFWADDEHLTFVGAIVNHGCGAVVFQMSVA